MARRQNLFDKSRENRMIHSVHLASQPRAFRLIIELAGQFERPIKRASIAAEGLLLESRKRRLLGGNAFGLPASLSRTGRCSVFSTSVLKLATPFLRPAGLAD